MFLSHVFHPHNLPFFCVRIPGLEPDLPRPKRGALTLTRYPEKLLLAPTLPAFAGAVRFALAFPMPFRPAASPWDAFICRGITCIHYLGIT